MGSGGVGLWKARNAKADAAKGDVAATAEVDAA
jgi:hypothetical protein